jgi:hypothetical protein
MTLEDVLESPWFCIEKPHKHVVNGELVVTDAVHISIRPTSDPSFWVTQISNPALARHIVTAHNEFITIRAIEADALVKEVSKDGLAKQLGALD